MRSNSSATIAAVLIAIIVAGCGEQKRPLGKVSGRVTFESKPVADGVVLFQNKAEGVYMTATTDESGSYRVVMAEGGGLPLGTYQVAVQPKPLVPKTGYPTPSPPKRPDIPAMYRSVESSKLTLVVKEGKNPFDIQLAR